MNQNDRQEIPLNSVPLEKAIDRQPLIVSTGQKVAEVGLLMEQTGKSYALVRENQQLVGIVTEKDLVKLAIRGTPLTEVALVSVMTKNPPTIPLSQVQDWASVSSIWQQHQITHLPIVDEENRPVGVITATTFLSSLLKTVPLTVPPPQPPKIKLLTCVGLTEFQAMFKAISEAVIFADTNRRIQILNPAALNLFGYQPEELIGQQTVILYASQTEYERQGRRRFNLSSAEQREPYEVNYRRRNGEEFIGETVGTVVKDDSGEIIGFLGIIRDITQQKQTERQLQNVEYLMQKISESTPNLFYIYDLEQQRNIYANRELADALGYSPHDIASMGSEIATHLFHPDELSRISAHHQKISTSQHQELFEIEYRVRHANSQWLWFYSWEVVFSRDRSGFPTQILGTAVNITRRKQLERELERFFSLSVDLFCVASTDGYFKRLNPAFEQILGHSQEELLSQPFINFVHPDDIEATLAEMDKLTNGMPTVSFENRYRCRDSEYKWLAWNAFPVPEEEVIYAVARDITERRQVESALRESQERLQAILDNASNVIYLKDIQGRYLLINHQFEKLFHLTREQIIGQMDSQIFAAEIAEVLRHNDRQILALGKSLEFEETVPQDDGLHTYISIKFPLWDSEGKAYGVCGISTDITERKQTEAALKQAQEVLNKTNAELEKRVEQRTAELSRSNQELEQFAYIVSHDLQEPLRKMKSFSQLLARECQDLSAEKEKIPKYLNYITDAADRQQKMIQALLNYSRLGRNDSSRVTVDLNTVVEKVLEDLSIPIAESQATVTLVSLPSVQASPSQMAQLFLNLIGNGIKFRGEAPPQIQITAKFQPKEWLISIKDNGIGINPKYAERIFQIFQRLHSRSQYPGTGIGLAICRKIIENHGGNIWFVSELDRGSTFYFTLPLDSSSS